MSVLGNLMRGAANLWSNGMARGRSLVLLLLIPLCLSSAQGVTLEWDPSPDPLVVGYRLYWGTESGVYDSSLTVGLTNAATVEGLAPAQTFYFVVTAANAAGIESVPSNELPYTTPLNRPPLAIGQKLYLSEDGKLSIPLTGTDPDGDALRFQIVRAPGRGTLSGTPPNVVYQPNPNVFGTDSFDFTVSDGQEISAPATVALSILAVNDPPVANPISLSTPAATKAYIRLTGSDPDGDPVSFAVVSPPSRGTLSGKSPSFYYTPQAGFAGMDSFSFVARDGKTTSAAATVVISVGAANSAPRALSQSVSTEVGRPVGIQLTGSDPDGDPLQYAVATPPYRGTLSGVPPKLIYTPQPGFAGRDNFTFSVSDGRLNSTAVAVMINVVATHQPPVAVSQNVSTLEDTPAAITLRGSDPEGQPLSYVVTTPPNSGTLSGTPPDLVFTPANDASGLAYFAFSAFDGELYSEPALVIVSVTAVNDAPIAEALNLATPKGQSAAFTLGAKDPEGSPLKYTILTLPTHGILIGEPPNLIYQPHPGYVGADQFEYAANDGSLASAPAVVEIRVTEGLVSGGATLAGRTDSTSARPSTAEDYSRTQVWVIAQESAVRAEIFEFCSTPPRLATPPAHGWVSFDRDGAFTYTSGADDAITDNFTAVGPAGLLREIRLSFLQLRPEQGTEADFEWTFESVPDARYWVQIHQGIPVLSDPPSAWKNFTWGIQGLEGTVHIPVPADHATAWFRVVSEQHGGIQVTPPSRFP